MKKLPLVALALGLLAVLGGLLRGGDEPSQIASAKSVQPTRAEEGGKQVNGARELARVAESPAARVVAETLDEELTSEAVAYPRSRVFGRVIDVRGTPLVDVSARLNSHRRWVSADLHPAELPSSYEARTDDQGRFEFEVANPTSEVNLTIMPGPYLTRAWRVFRDLAGGRYEDPLRPGDNDLGVFVLEDAGAVEGRVVDPFGVPIANALVRFDGRVPRRHVLSDWTGGDGRYRIGNLPPGHAPFQAFRDGYLLVQQEGVDVRVGVTTPGVDFELDVAPSITGRVVDEAGVPIENVRLYGWPRHNGRGAGGRTAEDGTFVVYLPQREPYSLGAQLDGYESIPDRGKEYEPRTTGIELVMKRLPTFIVRYSYGRTDAPVEPSD